MQGTLTILCSMATRNILAELAPIYRQRTGMEVAVRAMGGVEAAKAVRSGEPADLVMLAGEPLARLEREGHLLAGSILPFALSVIAVAVRKGAQKPDLNDAAGLRAAMLDARRIGYSTGPSGEYLEKLWQTWGIADAVKPKAMKAPPGVPVAVLIERGEVDLGVQQRSELLGFAGIDIAGDLPPDVQQITTFALGIATRTAEAGAARQLMAFLTSPEADAAKRAQGMSPPAR